MTKENLNEIIRLKREVEQLRQKLQDMCYGDNKTVVTDKVKGSMSQYPYSARSFTLAGIEHMSEECIKRRDVIGKKISDKYETLYLKVSDAIEYIQQIKDSDIRQIFMYRYIDGLKWIDIGLCMNYSGETVRKKHDNFIKSLPSYTDSKDI